MKQTKKYWRTNLWMLPYGGVFFKTDESMREFDALIISTGLSVKDLYDKLIE